MNKYNKSAIINFIWLLSKLCLFKPLIILIVVDIVIFYFLCHSFIELHKIDNVILFLFVSCLSLSISFFVSNALWNNAIEKSKKFADKVYTETINLLTISTYKYDEYLKFVSETSKTLNIIMNYKYLVGFIGVFINWIIILCIFNI